MKERKLGKRLKKIEAMVESGYQHIWDCCCDHGQLGGALLTRKAAKMVHFVDIVPNLIEELTNKLNQLMVKQEAPHWQTYCLDVTKIPVASKQGKQLIIIAGVGGDLMTHLVQEITLNNPDIELDFLLCPVHHNHTLRHALNKLDLRLKKEVLVEENRRIYEILFVTKALKQDPHLPKISAVGEQIWQTESLEQRRVATRYLATTLAHYQRMMAGKKQDIEPILHAYQQVSISEL
ncbi:tRNA (adenine(22)-N(1))-methyltransferase TrmK [Vibrio tapetis subsp. quintayensis]|uniref:tRNA (adenine(22)-N(1))-methyltransferase n=1 Tax=Vibrio tapetis TaxID=52443 RepID=UPI0025B2EA2B|nr:tRNA (adenine(22)-N(1))-methyltransferase TrmK [Vibrio tapetis]MDN3680797.1 tRNA (adenine(22)-N(1))-methyltransferase TrmK [Vibrio tapetis subsp. quintayensis]